MCRWTEPEDYILKKKAEKGATGVREALALLGFSRTLRSIYTRAGRKKVRLGRGRCAHHSRTWTAEENKILTFHRGHQDIIAVKQALTARGFDREEKSIRAQAKILGVELYRKPHERWVPAELEILKKYPAKRAEGVFTLLQDAGFYRTRSQIREKWYTIRKEAPVFTPNAPIRVDWIPYGGDGFRGQDFGLGF